MDRTPPFPAENMKGRVSKEQTTGDPLLTDFQKIIWNGQGRKLQKMQIRKLKPQFTEGQQQTFDPNLIWSEGCMEVL